MNEDKFTGKAAIYPKYRPSYPTAVVDRLYELTHAANVADIGAGTGKFTEKLLLKPWNVTAVEPNTDMCRELLKCVGGRAEIVMASAENTGLPEHSFELITAAQAFHWFDEEKFRDECRRMLNHVFVEMQIYADVFARAVQVIFRFGVYPNIFFV